MKSIDIYVVLNTIFKNPVDIDVELVQSIINLIDTPICNYYEEIFFISFDNLNSECKLLQTKQKIDKLWNTKYKDIFILILGYIQNINIQNINTFTPCVNKIYKDDINLLNLSIRYNRTNLCRLLLNTFKVDINVINSRLETALITAIYANNVDIVRMLMQISDIDVNIKYRENNSYLIILLNLYISNKFEIAKLLLKCKNIDINCTNKLGCTALLYLMGNRKCEDIELIELLLNHPDIDVNIKDNTHKNTALLYAINNNKADIVKSLLSNHTININYKNKIQVSALSLAVLKNNIEIVKLLCVVDNINIDITNRFSNTPLITAEYKGFTEIYRLLKTIKSIKVLDSK